MLPVLLVVAAAIALLPAPAAAASCGAVGGQAQVLKRQIAALRGLQAQRSCAGRSLLGGFFNACGDLSRRRAAAERALAGLGGGGCQVAQRRKAPARSREASGYGAGWAGRNAMLFCVRTADGYFFPVPSSQFLDAGDAKLSLDQCRYICRGSDVAVYKLPSPALESEEMVSVETGRAYRDLPTAFAYRDDPSFQKCDFPGYVRRVEEARARTVTPKNMANAIIPLPAFRPPAAPAGSPAMAATPPEADAGFEPLAYREVRVVGPDFFPE